MSPTTSRATSLRSLPAQPVSGNAWPYGATLFLACAFPYLTPIVTPFDTQPYAVISAAFTLLLVLAAHRGVAFPRQLLPFGLVLVYATAALLGNSELLLGFRSMVGYVSVFVLALAAFYTFRNVRSSHFLFAVAVWLAFGVVQFAVDRQFGSSFLSRLDTSETRGITSLAVEPSLYSVVCIYFLILNDIFLAIRSYARRTYQLVFLAVVLQLFFARAGVGVALFFVYLSVRLLSRARIAAVVRGVAILAFALTVFIASFRYVPALQATRLGTQLNIALLDPSFLMLSDASVTDRLVHVLISHSSVLHGNWLGFGLGNWGLYADDLAVRTGGLAYELSTVHMTTVSGKIMSGWGTAIFELGVVGFVFLGAFVHLMYRGWKRVNGELKALYVTSSVTLYFVMLMAVPMAFPLFGYLIGVFVYLQLNHDKIGSAGTVPAPSLTRLKRRPRAA